MKYTKKSKKPRAVKSVKKSIRRKPVVSLVKAVINKMSETKTARMLYTKVDLTGIAPYNGVNWGLDNGLFALTPVQNRITIAQGDGEADRTGNRIRTKSSFLSGMFFASPYDVTYNPVPRPQDVMVIIYKIIGGGNTIQTTLTGLYQAGNTTASPTTNLSDTILPINTDLYKIFYKKIFKVGCADATGTGNQAGSQYYSNNDYKRNCRFYIPITKYLDKVIKYDGTSTTANNSMLYMAVLPCNADGSQPATGNSLRPISMFMTQVFKYTDL